MIARYLLKRKIFYPDRYIGIGTLSNDLGLSPGRVVRGLRLLRRLGLVVRNTDPRRKKYSTWSLSRNFDDDLLARLVDYGFGDYVATDKISIYEWIDSFLDRYFLSGTVALLINGLSWSDVMPMGILIIAEKSEIARIKKFYRFYRKTSLGRRYRLDIVYRQNIDDCDYSNIRLENASVPVASVPQALVDSILNSDSWGVDILETLSVLIGIMVPRILENSDIEYVQRMISLAERQYGKKYELLLAVFKHIFMRYYIYFEDISALRIYLSVPKGDKEYRLSSKIIHKINEAFRATILGDRVAMYLGLEPDFSSQRSVYIPKEIFAVSEL